MRTFPMAVVQRAFWARGGEHGRLEAPDLGLEVTKRPEAEEPAAGSPLTAPECVGADPRQPELCVCGGIQPSP